MEGYEVTYTVYGIVNKFYAITRSQFTNFIEAMRNDPWMQYTFEVIKIDDRAIIPLDIINN